jgi:hypothetical protein
MNAGGGSAAPEVERQFTLKVKNNTLLFRTSSYRAERGSVLHSGIYNRELTSSLVAGGLLVAVAIAVVLAGMSVTGYHFALAAAAFVGLFIFFRVYVFFEDFLEVIIRRDKGHISVFRKGFRSLRRAAPLREVTGIRKGFTVIAPENPDGIKFVEKVALQHGTVIPGFGEVREYHTVNVEFSGGDTVMVFSTVEKADADEVLAAMRRFTEGRLAKED